MEGPGLRLPAIFLKPLSVPAPPPPPRHRLNFAPIRAVLIEQLALERSSETPRLARALQRGRELDEDLSASRLILILAREAVRSNETTTKAPVQAPAIIAAAIQKLEKGR